MERDLTEKQKLFVHTYLSNGRHALEAYKAVYGSEGTNQSLRVQVAALMRSRMIRNEIKAMDAAAAQALTVAATLISAQNGSSEVPEDKPADESYSYAVTLPVFTPMAMATARALREYVRERTSKDYVLFRASMIVDRTWKDEPEAALRGLELIARIEGLIIDRKVLAVSGLRNLTDTEINDRLRAVRNQLAEVGAIDVPSSEKKNGHDVMAEG